jgi:hypothetical protein
MRTLIAVILGTVVLSACSTAGAPSSSPIASVPALPSPSAAPATKVPTMAPATPAPSSTPRPEPAAVDLADVEIRPIATRAPAASCTAEDGTASSLDRAMSLADVPISFQFQSGGLRDDSAGVWSDSVPYPVVRFDSNDEHQTVEASAGNVVGLQPGSTITLIDGRLELYPLDADDRAGNVLPAATVDLGGDADGLDVPLPTQAGRWLLSVSAHWQTGCASGDGYVDLLLVTT